MFKYFTRNKVLQLALTAAQKEIERRDIQLDYRGERMARDASQIVALRAKVDRLQYQVDHPPHAPVLIQDLDRKLSTALSNGINTRQSARDAAAAIQQQNRAIKGINKPPAVSQTVDPTPTRYTDNNSSTSDFLMGVAVSELFRSTADPVSCRPDPEPVKSGGGGDYGGGGASGSWESSSSSSSSSYSDSSSSSSDSSSSSSSSSD